LLKINGGYLMMTIKRLSIYKI